MASRHKRRVRLQLIWEAKASLKKIYQETSGPKGRGCSQSALVDLTNLAEGRRFDDLECRRIFEQFDQNGVVHLVTTLEGAVEPQDRQTGQRQITNGIKRLVAGELIRPARAFRVQNLVVGDGDRVFQRRAQCEAHLPELLDILHIAESPGTAKLGAEYVRCHVGDEFLVADRRSVEINRDVKLGAIVRMQLTPGASGIDTNGLPDLQIPAAAVQLLDADLLDRLDERMDWIRP